MLGSESESFYQKVVTSFKDLMQFGQEKKRRNIAIAPEYQPIKYHCPIRYLFWVEAMEQVPLCFINFFLTIAGK